MRLDRGAARGTARSRCASCPPCSPAAVAQESPTRKTTLLASKLFSLRYTVMRPSAFAAAWPTPLRSRRRGANRRRAPSTVADERQRPAHGAAGPQERRAVFGVLHAKTEAAPSPTCSQKLIGKVPDAHYDAHALCVQPGELVVDERLARQRHRVPWAWPS